MSPNSGYGDYLRFIEFSYFTVLSTYFNIENLVSSALVLTISSMSSTKLTDLTQCSMISPVTVAYIDIINKFSTIYLSLFGSVLIKSGTLLLTLSLTDNPLNTA